MSPAQPVSLRKRPRQERSRETVERVIRAAAHVLDERGYDRTSTNLIAREAGVSPGSLYQYFADKDAIVSAVLERFVDGLSVVTRTQPESGFDAGSPSFGDQVHALLDVLEPRERLLRVLINEVPRLGPEDARVLLNQRIEDGFRFAAARVAESPADLNARSWAAGVIARTLLVRYVLDKPPIGRDQLIDTMTTAIAALMATPAR